MYYNYIVPPDVIAIQNQLLGVVNGSVMLSFVIERSSPPVLLDDISWTFNNGTSSQLIVSSNASIFSTDLLNLTLLNVQHYDEGNYSLTASNPAGTHTATIYLSIEGINYLTVSLTFLCNPQLLLYF